MYSNWKAITEEAKKKSLERKMKITKRERERQRDRQRVNQRTGEERIRRLFIISHICIQGPSIRITKVVTA